MAGVTDLIFGSGESGTTTSTQKPLQEEYLNDLFGKAKTATKTGPETGGLAAGNLAAADAFRNFAGGAGGFLAPAQNAQNFLLTQALDPSTNPNLQKYLDMSNESLTRNFQQQVLPSLRGGAVAAGNVGSSREGIAQGLAAQGLETAQGNAQTGILQGAYGQNLNAMLQALGLTPGLLQAGQQAPNALAAAAQLQGAGENAGYTGDITNLQNYLGLIGGQYGGTTTTQGPGTDTGGLPGVLGLLSSGAGIYSALQKPAVAGAAAGM